MSERLTAKVGELETTVKRLVEALEKRIKDANKAICMFCGSLGPKKPKFMLKHLMACKLHPLRKVMEVNDRYEEAIRWALGERGEFRVRDEGEPAFWWRSELRRRAAIQEKGA